MKIKVCGMKDPENMRALAELPIDMMGLIFYEKSPRCVDNRDAGRIQALSLTIPKVGVFVDASQDVISDKVKQFNLQFVQLHGNESPEFCRALKERHCGLDPQSYGNRCHCGLDPQSPDNKDILIIKAFQIKTEEDFKTCALYENCCDYFLFDTPTPRYGGSGNKFDWEILSAYKGTKPFFLSGGIAPEDAENIARLNFPQLFAVDLNSRFETAPGMKDIDSIRRFLNKTCQIGN